MHLSEERKAPLDQENQITDNGLQKRGIKLEIITHEFPPFEKTQELDKLEKTIRQGCHHSSNIRHGALMNYSFSFPFFYVFFPFFVVFVFFL